MRLLVTGGAGFIGSNFIRYMLKKYPDHQIINFDEVVKSRHPGENRGPVFCNYPGFLDTGFRRYDDFVEFSTFCQIINFDKLTYAGAAFGEVYNIGGGCEKTNGEITRTILSSLNKSEDLISAGKRSPRA